MAKKKTKAKKSVAVARRPTAAKAPAKRRRRKGLREGSGLSASSFTVVGKSMLEAGVGAILCNIANKAVANQPKAAKVIVNILVPVALSKFSGKPMLAAGAAGVGAINILKIAIPNSRMLADGDFMGALEDNGMRPAHWVNSQNVKNSRFALV